MMKVWVITATLSGTTSIYWNENERTWITDVRRAFNMPTKPSDSWARSMTGVVSEFVAIDIEDEH